MFVLAENGYALLKSVLRNSGKCWNIKQQVKNVETVITFRNIKIDEEGLDEDEEDPEDDPDVQDINWF